MTQLQVAKRLLLDANERIFNLECALAESDERIEDLEDEIEHLQTIPAKLKKLKRKYNDLKNGQEEDFEDLSDRHSEEDHSFRAKRTKPSTHRRDFHQDHAAGVQQHEAQHQEVDDAPPWLAYDASVNPLGGLPTMREQTPEPQQYSPTSPQDNRSSTLRAYSPSRYVPTSPPYSGPGEATSPQHTPISPQYSPASPDLPAYHFATAPPSSGPGEATSPQYTPTSPRDSPASPTLPAYDPPAPDYGAMGTLRTPSAAEGSSAPRHVSTSGYWPVSPNTSGHWPVSSTEAEHELISTFNPERWAIW